MTPPPLVGVVHLAPLPGAPRYAGDMAAVVRAAVDDAVALVAAGFDALIVENYGDVPFHPDRVPPATAASMSRVLSAITDAVDVALGVNVLRNDAEAALGIAVAHGAAFIRVNVLSGLMYTDQGPIVGRADRILRERASLSPSTAIYADVFVKHAVPPPGTDLARAAEDLAERAVADALIVTGPGTGQPVGLSSLATVRGAVSVPVLIGSGARVETLPDLQGMADGIIVGSSIRKGGRAGAPVDIAAARRFVETARSVGFVS